MSREQKVKHIAKNMAYATHIMMSLNNYVEERDIDEFVRLFRTNLKKLSDKK